jgi:hypothetical protein
LDTKIKNKAWGIPRSFRLSNKNREESVNSVKERCMKNEFIHTEYDPNLKSFIAQLFLKHIFPRHSSDSINQDEIGDMNMMDFLFEKLSTDELLDIENKINNEHLYNKDQMSIAPESKHKKRSNRLTIDQDPFSNRNLFRLFKERVDKGPNVFLSVERKRRVFDAIEDGLSKYLPRKQKRNFSNMIQMVEKLLNAKEDKSYILSKLDLPPGRMYIKEMEQDRENQLKRIQDAKSEALEVYEKDEANRKKNEEEVKNTFFRRMTTANLNEEERIKIDKQLEQEKFLIQQQKIDVGKFVTELPSGSESEEHHDDDEVLSINEMVNTNFNPKGSFLNDTTATSKIRGESSQDARKSVRFISNGRGS